MLCRKKALLAFSYTGWGWTHLIMGILVIAAGVGVLSGKTWAIFVGVFLAVLSALANITFFSAYPLWAIIAITVDVMIIYALTMHGSELRD